MTPNQFTYAELFAGAGGMSRGLDAAGFLCALHAEIEPHARAVLRYRWPDTPLHDDVTTLDGRTLKGITLLSGGSPCQDLSVAGKRAGMTEGSGTRSSLFFEQVRVWRESEAPYCLWENVAGAFSSNNGADFASVLSAFVGATVPVPADGWRGAGVATGPAGIAAWRLLDLQHFGVPQRRRRVFVLAARWGGCDPARVLAVGQGVPGDTPASRQARQSAARRVAGGARGGGYGTVDDGQIAFHATQTPVHGAEAPRHGASARIGVYANTSFSGYTDSPPTLGASGGDLGNGGSEALVLDPLTASMAKGATGHNRDGTDDDGTIAAKWANGSGGYAGDEHHNLVVSPTLNTTHFGKHQASNQHVAELATLLPVLQRPRRLTPAECERLMSWPTGWTARGVDEDGTPYLLSDTARYRLCGNGAGSIVLEWIGRRLMNALTQAAGIAR